MKKNFIFNLKEMDNFSKKFVKKISFPLNILLFGNLGSGKTTFAKFFIQNFFENKSINVTSPTFTIIQNYSFPGFEKSIIHADLYRIINKNELEEIDIFYHMAKDICLIEWPEIIENFCSENVIKIYIKINENNSSLRNLKIIDEYNLLINFF